MKLIEGYASVFFSPSDSGTEYRIAADVSERIMPGTFDRSLKSSDEIVALWNHNPDFLLGRRSAYTLRLSVDQRGLKYSIDANLDDPQHATVYQKLLRGDVKGSSFSMANIKDNVRRTAGGFIREIYDVELIEVSPVWYPAYSSSTSYARGASVRDASKDPIQRRLTELQNASVADRLRELREDRLKHLEREAVLDRLRYLEVTR